MNSLKIGVIGLKGLPAYGGAATVGENIIYQLKHKYIFTVYAVSSHTQPDMNCNAYKQIVFRRFFIKKLNIFFYYLKSAFHSIFMAKYDLIHLHHTDGAFILPILRLKYKVVCTSHAQPQVNEKWPSWVKLFFSINEQITMKLSSTITAVSIPLTKTYQKNTKKKIHYIPNGINLKQEVDIKNLECSNYILFAAGRIIPLKGLHILLHAMKKINLTKKLLVIGDLEQISSYKTEILKLSKDTNIVFIPIIRQKGILLNYVNRAIFFIFPSYSENMSIMLLEVAFVKTPLICSDIEPNMAIFNYSEVLFFKTNDPNDLRDKIKYAEENPTIMKEKALRAYNKVKTYYNWESISKQYDNLFYQTVQTD